MQKENKKREQPVKKSNKAVDSFTENVIAENCTDEETIKESIAISENSVEEIANQSVSELNINEAGGNFSNNEIDCSSNCCETEKETNPETIENFTGSLGKFKDTQSLLAAYNNLQAEFTRKCQRLKEFERGYQPQNSRTTMKYNENLNDKNLDNKIELEKLFTNLQSPTTANEQAILQVNVQNQAEKQSEQSQAENEPLNLQEVIKSQQENQSQAREQSSPTNLETLLNNSQVKEYILNRNDIKESVLKIYFEELRASKPPKVISSLIGSGIALKTPPKPTNMEEAKEIINKMFHL